MRTPKLHVASNGEQTWKVQFRLAPGRDGKITSETFTEERKALKFCQLLDVLGPAGALKVLDEDVDRLDVPTMDVLAADHIEHLTGIEDGTRLNYTRLWGRTWSPLIGRLPADDPELRDRIRLATNTLATRYKYKSLQNQRGLLAGVCERGVEKKYMPANPTKKLRLPRGVIDPDGEDDEHDMRLIEQSEFGILVDAMSPQYKLLVKFLAGTGVRWGEVVVLQKRNFTLDPPRGSKAGPVVRIRRALKWSPDGDRKIGYPKTSKSRRTIAIPRELIDELRQVLDQLRPGDLVFTNAGGRMIQHRTFWSDHWRPAVWRAGNCAKHIDEKCRCGTAHPERCKLHSVVVDGKRQGRAPEPCGCAGTLSVTPRIHDTRHSHASWLLAAGVPIHVVQIRLGHESITTTVGTYSHLLPDAQIAAAEAASAAFTMLTPAAQEREVQQALAGLDALLTFLEGGDDLPDELTAALIARGWSPPKAAIEA
jgi:integrase